MVKVTECVYIKELLYYIELSNNTSGLVNFAPLAEKFDEFKQVLNEDKGEQYYLDGYSIEWYNGADIAPEWLESQLAQKAA
ncbi:DUF2442 domain-containing protein [Acinetobacter sp. LMB-5]|uniref:DUF2442 domain-containing protein n=1 Tax=Acinetobacter sp. LMB-5 TaxID=1609919 RepID=UPI00076111BF|nr:DUF2442 domain-containing protein [Acinetobacter sp. LMB-5]